MEAVTCAAQESALAMKYVQKVYKQDVNPICHICCKENETISHVLNGCELLVATKFTKQHNTTCECLHWCMVPTLKVLVHPNWQ
eukprot:6591604-Ditylum_brightwellii.AAC.1